MNATFRDLSALAIAFSISTATSSAYLQGSDTGKAKGKLNVGAKGNNGRKAGELPFGPDQFSKKRENFHQDRKRRYTRKER